MASKKAREAIIKALAQGKNPETIGPALRDILGVPLHRALRISRTETLRAYRTASHETFKENEDMIDGWIWSSSGDQNTCAYCRSQDGKFFPLDEPIQSHPNCRCVQIPRTKTWEELGIKPKKGQDAIPDSRPEINSGDFEFSKLTREQQLELLGKERLAAYEAGDVVLLEDFFQETEDPVWGKQVRKPTLEMLLGTDLAGRYKDGFERNESLPDVLARVERNIRDRAKEVSTIFDSNGRILFRRSGTDTAISFTKEELEALKGKVLTHNHPYSGIGEDGGTFSPSDIVLAAKSGLDEIRIVTRDSVGRTILYTMQADNWPSLNKLEGVITMGVNTYSEHDGVGPMSEFEQKRTYLEIWKELSKLLRLRYTRREI
ncbi:MAG TPA: phage minor head protein [Acidobacteriota bacterium]|nr:phage minor head protein [Acidobacteriota bacterium]